MEHDQKDPRVPYALLERAEANGRDAFPDADEVKALWVPANACEVALEVWRDGKATVISAARLLAAAA